MAGLGLASAGIIYDYGGDDFPPGFDIAHSDLTPAEARAFNDFPLYSAGDSFEGLPLVAITRRLDPPISESDEPITVRGNFAGFIYGDCEAESDSGCAPPLQIQIWPACERNLSVYPDDDWFVIEKTKVRGVPAAFFEGGRRLEVYTGDVSIVMFGESRGQLLRAAAALQRENGGVGPNVDLPAPARGAVEGRLRC